MTQFDFYKALHTVLFTIQSLGGRTEVFKLFTILYLADRKHLSRHGTLILGDSYIALKSGIVPFRVYTYYKQLRDNNIEGELMEKIQKHIAVHQQQVIALTSYNGQYLASSEAECLFDVIHTHKQHTPEAMMDIICADAWKRSDVSGHINLLDMAREAGASTDIIQYISLTLLHRPQFN